MWAHVLFCLFFSPLVSTNQVSWTKIPDALTGLTALGVSHRKDHFLEMHGSYSNGWHLLEFGLVVSYKNHALLNSDHFKDFSHNIRVFPGKTNRQKQTNPHCFDILAMYILPVVSGSLEAQLHCTVPEGLYRKRNHFFIIINVCWGYAISRMRQNGGVTQLGHHLREILKARHFTVAHLARTPFSLNPTLYPLWGLSWFQSSVKCLFLKGSLKI